MLLLFRDPRELPTAFSLVDHSLFSIGGGAPDLHMLTTCTGLITPYRLRIPLAA